MKRHYPNQDICLGVVCGAPLLAFVVVLLRFYARKRKGVLPGWDDWLVAAAVVLSLAYTVPSYLDVKMWHKGIHIWDVPPEETEPDYDNYFVVMVAENLLCVPILPLVKASIIVLLLRVGSVLPNVRRALYAAMVFNIVTCVIPWCFLLFECPPLTGRTWKPRTFGNLHCLSRVRAGNVLLLVNCTNLLTDILIFPIPFLIIRKASSLTLWARTAVLLVFASSLAVTGISASKIYITSRDRIFDVPLVDWTYNIDFCVTHVENNIAIIIACVPAVRHLLQQKRGDRDNPYSGQAPRRTPYWGVLPLRSSGRPFAKPSFKRHSTTSGGASNSLSGIKITTEVELTGFNRDSMENVTQSSWERGWPLPSDEHNATNTFSSAQEIGNYDGQIAVYELKDIEDLASYNDLPEIASHPSDGQSNV